MTKVQFEEDPIIKNLNDRQKYFCELYCFDKECFGNGTAAYMRAYNLKPTQRVTARIAASNLLTNINVKNYRKKLMRERYNNESIDARHSQLIHQDKNLIVAMQAVAEFNKIKKRVDEAPTTQVVFQWKGDQRPKKPTVSTPENLPKSSRKTKDKFIINGKSKE